MGLRQNSTNRIGNTMSEEHDKMMPDEASDKGGDILSHFMKIYNLIECGDKTNEWVRVEMYKDRSMSVINHKDVEMGLAPSIFTLNEDGEWEEKVDEA